MWLTTTTESNISTQYLGFEMGHVSSDPLSAQTSPLSFTIGASDPDGDSVACLCQDRCPDGLTVEKYVRSQLAAFVQPSASFVYALQTCFRVSDGLSCRCRGANTCKRSQPPPITQLFPTFFIEGGTSLTKKPHPVLICPIC